MWTNSLLKQNAWKKLKPYYWTAFGVTIMQILVFYLPFHAILHSTFSFYELHNKYFCQNQWRRY